MIWVENNKTKEKRLCINADLMHANYKVLEVQIVVLKSGIHIAPKQDFNHALLPYRVEKNHINLMSWIKTRCLFVQTHRNIFFTELALTEENRDPRMPFILSLSVNCVSLADKYWLNPHETTEFTVNGANILFEKKTWDEVDPFRNLYKPGRLEEYALNDIFMEERYSRISAKSLIWSTSGAQNKRWMLDDKGYYLEKKLTKEDFENEIQAFEFFSKTDVVIPEYKCCVRALNRHDEKDFNSFSLDTISEGLFIVQKRCLTNTGSYLLMLYDYVEDPHNLQQAIRTMCNSNRVSIEDTETFISLISEYQKQFDVPAQLINTKNIGLLITKQNAKPVVWGRLKLKFNGFGQITE